MCTYTLSDSDCARHEGEGTVTELVSMRREIDMETKSSSACAVEKGGGDYLFCPLSQDVSDSFLSTKQIPVCVCVCA